MGRTIDLMASAPPRTGSFRFRGQRLAYSIYGAGDRPVILTPGLLLPARMHQPLAEYLASRGNKVVLFDPLGHGRSDRSTDMWRYSMSTFAAETVALLDHLGIDAAVIGGTSLGANITLEVMSMAPERVRGMVIEMPVLDNALLACAIAFAPLLVALTLGEPVMRAVSWVTRKIPSRLLPFYGDVLLDALRQDPKPSGALLQGLFFGRVAPHRDERRSFQAPTLIVGHRRDPIHPFSDADMLARELPNATLVPAESILELRFNPDDFFPRIGDFIDSCWRPQVVRRRRRGRQAS